VRQRDEERAYGGGWIDRSAAEIHAPVGLAVTPMMCTHRVSISITKKTYRRLRNTVSTCEKSHDRIPDA
jgi:hypothetical protein